MKIFDLLSWIFLILGIVVLIWFIFGNSPSEIFVILPFIFMIIFKLWSISDELIKLKLGFRALAKDFKLHISSHI